MAITPKLHHLLKAWPRATLQHTEKPLMPPPNDTETALALFKIFLAWAAYFFGAITLHHIGVSLAIIFTALQIIVLLRDKFGWFTSKE